MLTEPAWVPGVQKQIAKTQILLNNQKSNRCHLARNVGARSGASFFKLSGRKGWSNLLSSPDHSPHQPWLEWLKKNRTQSPDCLSSISCATRESKNWPANEQGTGVEWTQLISEFFQRIYSSCFPHPLNRRPGRNVAQV